jgi:hypothetical protein
MEIIIGITVVVFGIFQIILFFKIWGMTDDIREIKNKYINQHNIITEKECIEKKKAAKTNSEKDVFEEGDLVIVKATENQFRISIISEVDGVTYYSRSANEPSYRRDELEFFELYWEKKKSMN